LYVNYGVLTCHVSALYSLAQTLEVTVDNVHRIMASQADLKAACETIEAYQNELDAGSDTVPYVV
jgi:hypothetical protein